MRIRLPFAGAFLCLVGLSAFLGLFPSRQIPINDKVLHFIDFFLLTITFYFLLDASRRRVINFTLILCTFSLGIGSEILQALVPNGRSFDIYDIAANLLGSLTALGLCSWYHKRMLERKRLARRYHAVPTTEEDAEAGLDAGMEMPERDNHSVVANDDDGVGQQQHQESLETRVERWDENAEEEEDIADDDAGGIVRKVKDSENDNQSGLAEAKTGRDE
ncbi:MAG: Transcriptional activator spt7 [Watsoniomyces obsoletus]|nr:MAG: Transcriptional activator spt7 [Watsoniomyces obsoletus]